MARLATRWLALADSWRAERLAWRPMAIFLVASLALLLASINANIVAVGLPAIMEGLDTNLVWAGWVLTAYALSQTVVMPLAGKLSDDFGRKRLFLACVLLFTVSSLLCALAPNIYLLILFRVLQALGGGAFLPSAAGIVSDAFSDRSRTTALGLFTSVFPIGGILGPNIGGLVIDHFGWRAMFFVNVPIGLALLVLGWIFLPAGGRHRAVRSIDLPGLLAFALGIVGVLYAMTVWGNSGRFAFQVALWFAVGLAALVAFIWHEARAADPMIEPRLLRERAFFATNLYNFLYGALVFGFFSFIPLYATLEYGMSATEAGLILTPRAVAMIAFSTLSSFLLIRTGYRAPMAAGILIISAGLFLISRGWHDVALAGHPISNLVLLSALLALPGVGVGIGGPAANNAAIELMPEAVGRITGLRGMFRSTGGVLGTATIVLALTRFPDQAEGLERIFLALALLILLAIPPIFLIPDRARERREGESRSPE